jgi:polysaccharide export outer membrane protein
MEAGKVKTFFKIVYFFIILSFLFHVNFTFAQGILNLLLRQQLSTQGVTPYPLTTEKKTGELSNKQQKNVPQSFSSKIYNQTSYTTNAFFPYYYSYALSSIEKEFLKRTFNYNETLKQFGYDFFTKNVKNVIIPGNISVGKKYILGPGDELFVYIIGQIPGVDLSQFPTHLSVDREGKVYIPGLGVFYVWGLTLGQAEKMISRALKINIKLTLGKLRTFPVYISGEVNSPGVVVATALNTVIDALIMAGGVKKTGSLRNIVLTRTEGTKLIRKKIDLYELLLKGEPLNITLKDGDVIFVPPIGKVAGIAGGVKRPGIYELKGNETVEDLIKMAGGILSSGYKYKVILERYFKNKTLKVIEGSLDNFAFLYQKVKDGDLVIIQKIYPQPENFVKIEGEVKYPGYYAYKPGLKLSQLLTKDMFLLSTDMNYAEIIRRNPNTFNVTQIIKFSPVRVLQKKVDISLKPYDIIKFYPRYAYEPVKISGCVKNPMIIPYHEGLTLKEVLSGIEYCDDISKLKAVILKSERKISKKITDQNKKNYKLSRAKSVFLYNLLVKKQIKNILLSPGDEIVIKKVKPNEVVEKVFLIGYVKKPGVYPLKEGITLYDIFKMAGGFRKEAYPRGIIILRKSIADLQRKMLSQAIIKMKKEVEKEEAGIMQAQLSPSELQARRAALESKKKLLELMEKTEVTGRITGLEIPENLEELKNSPYNIILEDGDQIIIPKKPAEILVFGEVNTPSALVYHPGYTIEDYIKLAGGFTKDADVSNIFVIKANGASISSGFEKGIIWDSHSKRYIFGAKMLTYVPKPGEAIVIPTKVKVPVIWRPLIKDVIQIIYQSALTVYTISHL